MASRRGEEAHGDGLEEEYIDMDLSPAVGREFEFHFHMSAPLDRSGQPPLASPADELFYKGKLLPLHMPPRVQMVEELLLDGAVRGRAGPRLGGLAVSTAPATPCERSRGVSPANSCFVSGELNVEEFFREYAAGMALADDDDAASAAGGERKPWSRRLRFVRQLNLGRQLKASKAYLKTMFAGKQAGAGGDDKNGLGGKDLSGHGHGHSHGHHPRVWRKNPFGHIRSNRCITEQSGGGGGRAGHRRSFSSVVVRYSASSKTSPAPAPPSSSSCSSTSSSSKSSTSSSVRCSSDSDGAGTGAPALRRSSSASSEAENPIQGLIAYCKKSQQLASVRKSASDAGFRFLSSSAASKVAAESEGHDELIEICSG
ncbi:hypothetical protein CFC21_012593 [Triticum aestivum]|uniref:Membrane-associated kinase regulator 4 n=2 Tax=Triticum aestivum TaxID=4565 RepID=A0A9R1DQH1_WHEAT|nr:probable membrane-associated kinase regulator 4 [Triticum aestivum]KAF6996226.1 hypothetical protein CFC21_012593 [Triticum aestivum]